MRWFSRLKEKEKIKRKKKRNEKKGWKKRRTSVEEHGYIFSRLQKESNIFLIRCSYARYTDSSRLIRQPRNKTRSRGQVVFSKLVFLPGAYNYWLPFLRCPPNVCTCRLKGCEPWAKMAYLTVRDQSLDSQLRIFGAPASLTQRRRTLPPDIS